MRLWGKKETYIDIPSSFPSGKKYIDRDFLCGPVVKYLPSSAGDGGSVSGLGTKIPHATG